MPQRSMPARTMVIPKATAKRAFMQQPGAANGGGYNLRSRAAN